jgi:ABC-type sugar transport system substrate-binding protein
MKKPLFLLIALVSIVGFLAGCAGPEATTAPAEVQPSEVVPAEVQATDTAPAAVQPTEVTPEKLTIGALWLDASEFYTGVKAGIVAEAANKGIDLNMMDSNSNGDADTEANQMQTLIGVKANAIIISAVSTTSSVALIQQAHDAGIPVICYNSCINTDDAEKYVYAYVTGDQHQQGYDTGKAMGDYFVAAGITDPKIGVVGCEQYGVCQDRIKGFTEALMSLVPGAEIVDDQQAIEVDTAAETATNMLTAHPDISAFYCEAGNMIQGAAVAIQQAGAVGNVVVFGHDISPATAKLVINGSIVKYINAMIAEDFGKTSLDLALNAINGEPNSTLIYNMDPVEFFSTDPAKAQTWLDGHQ